MKMISQYFSAFILIFNTYVYCFVAKNIGKQMKNQIKIISVYLYRMKII